MFNVFIYAFHFQGNRYAAPFKEPVNPSEVPNYYNVVKVPMGKYTGYIYVQYSTYNYIKDCTCLFTLVVFYLFQICKPQISGSDRSITRLSESLLVMLCAYLKTVDFLTRKILPSLRVQIILKIILYRNQHCFEKKCQLQKIRCELSRDLIKVVGQCKILALRYYSIYSNILSPERIINFLMLVCITK